MTAKLPIEHRLMRLLKERGYHPNISRGPDCFWIISFCDPKGTTYSITAESLVADQWWLETEVKSNE